MAIKKNSKKEVETKEEVKQLEIAVKRAKDFSDDENTAIAVDLVVNGVTIYNCWYREGKKEDGTEYSMLAFPSRKDDKTGKYYNHAYVKLSKDDVENIASQIEQLI